MPSPSTPLCATIKSPWRARGWEGDDQQEWEWNDGYGLPRRRTGMVDNETMTMVLAAAAAQHGRHHDISMDDPAPETGARQDCISFKFHFDMATLHLVRPLHLVGLLPYT